MHKHKLLLFCSLAIFTLASHAAPQQKPNIIYILADDLGIGDLGCYGQKILSTPNIDRLARQGMRFTRHYSGSTVCAPSRCALLTGMHTGHTVVRGNAEIQPEGQVPMPADTFTVSKMLHQSGYTTGCFGKWGLGAPGSSSDPLQSGFDHFYGYNCQRQAHHYYPYFLWNDNQREILWNNFDRECGDYAPDLIHEQTLDFVRENKDLPFFCYYALVQPHAEMVAPEKFMAKYRGKFIPESSFQGCDSGPKFRKGDYASQPEAHAAFAAMVEMLDNYVGDVLDTLNELGLTENTIVFFASDNGPHVEGGHDPEYFNSNGGVRGFKRDLYEGGIHVPLIASWPGTIRPGTTSDHLSAFWDFLPTVAALTGNKVPEGIDGISMLPTLLQEPNQQLHDTLYWEFPGLDGRTALRKGDWKVVRYNVHENPNAPVELYNLTEDPSEKNNLANTYPEKAEQLDRLMKSARTQSPNPAFNFGR
jgi:arylsulfatase A-like enzyme